jgi:DNA-directed RNA polymerase specialized sigma24 family protein
VRSENSFFEYSAALPIHETTGAANTSLPGKPGGPAESARSAAGAHLPGDAALLDRMRRGDREAVGQFLTCYGPYIRRRVRGKLSPSMRRLFDSQELLSTLGRRLDRFVHAGRLTSVSNAQFWALIFRMLDNAVIDKNRVLGRLNAVEGEDSDIAQTILRRVQKAESVPARGIEVELDELLRLLRTPTERQIVSLWLTGHSMRIIAEYVGVSQEAMRQRWVSIRQHLRTSLEELV